MINKKILQKEFKDVKIGEYFLYKNKIYIKTKRITRKEPRGENSYIFCYFCKNVKTGNPKDIGMKEIVDIYEPLNFWNYESVEHAIDNYIPVFAE